MTAAALSLSDRLGDVRPRVLLTLGSGLGALADEVADPQVMDFGEIGLPAPTVPGHAGRLIAGELTGVPVLVQQGRVHLYEGVGVRDVTACVRAAADVGVETFIVTNAAGGLRSDLQPGDVLAISDHLNLSGANPLIGRGGSPAFIDMKDAYDPRLRDLARDVAEQTSQRLVEGIYAGLAGPSYETPAEVAMLRGLGADAVGMSTVAEVIEARAQGLAVLGLSLITNVHRQGGTSTDHAEVLEVGRSGGPRLAALVRALLGSIP